jgi:RNA polymerase sigma factor (sigma-70 family)
MEILYCDNEIVVCVKPQRVLSTDEPGGVPELVRQELKHTMDTLLSTLTPRQRQVLRLHFGMEDGTCHSLSEIGQIMGISKQRARQIEGDAMGKLKKSAGELGLEDFLTDDI